VQIYPTVGHSFFRQDLGTVATREIADAWDRVVSFLKRSFA
jgi:dienelactone hydrolase